MSPQLFKIFAQIGCKSEATNYSIYCIAWSILAVDFIDIVGSVITHVCLASWFDFCAAQRCPMDCV